MRWAWWAWAAAAIGGAAACNGDKEGHTGPAPETGADTAADTDTDTDTGAPPDTGTPPPALAELAYFGEAIADADGFTGTERIVLTAEQGAGDVICEIHYSLQSVGVRADCPYCDWAFDLEIGDATVVTDPIGACLTVIGVDATTVGSWNGTLTTYGYVPAYFGHAEVLLTEDGGDWRVATYVYAYDEATGELAYDWVDSTEVPY